MTYPRLSFAASIARRMTAAAAVLTLAACSDLLTGIDSPSLDVQRPDVTQPGVDACTGAPLGTETALYSYCWVNNMHLRDETLVYTDDGQFICPCN